jgi:hypothetical protein
LADRTNRIIRSIFCFLPFPPTFTPLLCIFLLVVVTKVVSYSTLVIIINCVYIWGSAVYWMLSTSKLDTAPYCTYVHVPRYSTPCRGLRPGHKARPHQKIVTTTAPAFPYLSHAFFPGTVKETYNQDSTISIYLKEIFFYLHLLPEKHNPTQEYYTSTNKIQHVK